MLASVDTPFLVVEAALLASAHDRMGRRLMERAATEPGDCEDGGSTVGLALRCLAERTFRLADRLRL